MKKISACIFDLDGVIVDTAKYHFLAWKTLADNLEINFTEEHNELLKGVSRMRSLEIILEIGGKTISEEEKIEYTERKNKVYLDYIRKMEKNEILPGVKSFIQELKSKNIFVALGSASKNVDLILKKLEIEDLFNAIIDGNKVVKAKPDPEVFLKGAQELDVDPKACVVFEDAIAGVEAAKNAGMFCVGVGDKNILKEADMVITSFEGLNIRDILGVAA